MTKSDTVNYLNVAASWDYICELRGKKSVLQARLKDKVNAGKNLEEKIAIEKREKNKIALISAKIDNLLKGN